MVDDKNTKMQQNIILENREKLFVSGVRDVKSFDEESIVISTVLGELQVKGSSLRVGMYNAESGDMTVEGRLHAFGYRTDAKNVGLLGRLFK